jgi:hypothetical protein
MEQHYAPSLTADRCLSQERLSKALFPKPRVTADDNLYVGALRMRANHIIQGKPKQQGRGLDFVRSPGKGENGGPPRTCAISATYSLPVASPQSLPASISIDPAAQPPAQCLHWVQRPARRLWSARWRRLPSCRACRRPAPSMQRPPSYRMHPSRPRRRRSLPKHRRNRSPQHSPRLRRCNRPPRRLRSRLPRQRRDHRHRQRPWRRLRHHRLRHQLRRRVRPTRLQRR